MCRFQRVILVEDDETDEALAVRSIRRSGLEIELGVARNGEEACEMLRTLTDPVSLVLLDIKLPLKSGFEVLEFLRGQPSTHQVPVVMLTSSCEPSDIERAFELGANSYIQKQIDPEISDSKLKLALYYWLAVDSVSDKSAVSFRQPLIA